MLHHPSIVAIHEAGLHAGQPYFSMDYVHGQNLAQIVGARPLPARKAAHYVRLIAEAIQHAHDQGILHRDLKPSNVLIDAATDTPRVTDFGLAKRLDVESTLTTSGEVLGSPNFMPPEQAGSRQGKVGRRSDVYGLGAILFYSLTARPPFQGATLETTIHEVLNTEPLPPRLLNPSIPRDLDTLCLKCLEKDPARRYATAQELADELGRFLRGEPILARPVTRAERVWRWCQRKPTVALLTVATVLGVCAVAIISTVAAVRLKISQRALELENYAANISQARRLVRDGESDRAMDLLLKCPEDLRHWEWGRLVYECHQEVLTLSAHTNIPVQLGDKIGPVVPILTFNPESTHLLTVGSDGVAKAWGTDDGRNRLTFGGATNRVDTAAFHPKEPRLALGCSDGVVRFWNTLSWVELPSLKITRARSTAPPGASPQPQTQTQVTSIGISHLTYSPDGNKLAAATRDNEVVVRDTIADRELFRVAVRRGPVAQLLFTADGTKLVAKIDSRRVQELPGTLGIEVWDGTTGRELFGREFDTTEVRTLFIAPNGEQFTTLDRSDRIELWSGTNYVRQLKPASAQLQHHNSHSPDGRFVCLAGEGHSTRIVDSATGQTHLTMPGRVYWTTFSPDGAKLATLSADRFAHVWDVARQRQILALRGHHSRVHNLTFSPDNHLAATAAFDGVVKIWNTSNGRELIRGPSWPWGGAFSPDGRRLSLAAWFDDLVIWDTHSGADVLRLNTRKPFIIAAVFSPDGRHLVTTGTRAARIFDAETGQQVGELRGHQRVTWSLAYSPDGRTIATGSFDRTVKLWDAETGRLLQTLAGHPQYVLDVAFDPTGRKVVSASGPASNENCDPARVWDVASGKLLFQLGEPGRGVLRARFHPNGRSIIAMCADRRFRVWDAETARLLHTWPTRGIGWGLSLSPDGKRMASPKADVFGAHSDVAMTEIWDAEQGRQLLDLQGHEDHAYDPVFSPDGRTLLTVSLDLTGRLWETFPWRDSDYPRGPAGASLRERIDLHARNYWRDRIAAERSGLNRKPAQPHSRHASSHPVNPFDWPARDSQAPPELIDLTAHYNSFLDITHGATAGIDLDNDLENLPRGLTTFETIPFDIRGVMTLRRHSPLGHLDQWMWDKFPNRVNGIEVRQKVRRLHVLHASCMGPLKDGAPIGNYVWHYANGDQREFPILFGRDLHDWWESPDTPSRDPDRAKVIWTGTNPHMQEVAPNATLRLYLRTYDNPQPDLELTSIDIVSNMTTAALFVVAMTVE